MSIKKRDERGPGLLLGKYELGCLLGRGTFAKVYFARSVSDSSPVAVKVLDKTSLVNSGVAPLILREVSAMRRLADHPNILKLHEVMATKSKIYLVMEHAKDGELFSRLARRGRLPEPAARRYFQQLISALRFCLAHGELFSSLAHRGRLPEPAARRYFQQLISALRFCHAHVVSHRDVKPENLLLDRDGNLKLSDFGLSALPDQLRFDELLHTGLDLSRLFDEGRRKDLFSTPISYFNLSDDRSAAAAIFIAAVSPSDVSPSSFSQSQIQNIAGF